MTVSSAFGYGKEQAPHGHPDPAPRVPEDSRLVVVRAAGPDGRLLTDEEHRPTRPAIVSDDQRSSGLTPLLRLPRMASGRGVQPKDVRPAPGTAVPLQGVQSPLPRLDPQEAADAFERTVSWALARAAEACIAAGLSPEEAAQRLDFACYALKESAVGDHLPL